MGQGKRVRSDRTSTSPQIWRLFCAAELPENVRTRLERHIQRLRAEVPDASASWSRPQNMHLTLKFFGNVDQNRTPRISEAISRAVGKPIPISVFGCGVFPKPSQPRVLWIGINDPSGELAELQRRLEEECFVEEFEKEGRAFRPHLTVARLRSPEAARALAESHLQMKFAPTEVLVNELVLFRSELTSKGSIYTTISRHPMS
jgi:2'-5' RNA ligase